MSRYAIKRTFNKISKKVSDLYFNIYIFDCIFSLLEVCKLRHKRDTAF